jgi:hypothetical protein
MKTLPIGTKVYHVFLGEGEVVACYPTEFYVKFKDKESEQHYNEENTGLLSLRPYTLEKGGFLPITEWGKAQIGDWGYFWNDHKTEPIRYGLLSSINKGLYFMNGAGVYTLAFTNFSEEIPEEYIDYVNNLK